MIERLDVLRDLGWKALTSDVGQGVKPVRWVRGAARFVNELIGSPLAAREELVAARERDADYATRLADAEAQLAAERAKEAAEKMPRREAAPVDVYKDDKSTRDLMRIATVLKGRDIPFKELDIEHDEASRSWATTKAHTHEFPLVFIAGEPVGGYDALVQLDASGQLVKRVFG